MMLTMENIEDLADLVAAHKLELAASNIQHLIKVNKELVTVEAICASLERSMMNADANNPMDICNRMVMQTALLDGVFNYYLDNAKGKYTEEEKISFAMRAQAQSVRTALAWKRLKTDTYVKHRIVKYVPEMPNNTSKLAERTEQSQDAWLPKNAPVDR